MEKVSVRPGTYRDFMLISGVGFIFLCMNFPKLLSLWISRVKVEGLRSVLFWPVQATQDSLASLQGNDPGEVLSRMMTHNFLGIWLLGLLVLLGAARQRDRLLPLFCLGGLGAGYFGLHLISWISLVVFRVMGWLALFIGWVRRVLGIIFGFVLEYWFIWVPVLVLVSLWTLREPLIEWLRKHFGRLLLWLSIVFLLGLVTYMFLPSFWEWLLRILEPVIRFLQLAWVFIMRAFHFLLGVGVWLFAIATVLLACFLILNIVGRLVVDQLRAAWNCGRTRKELGLSSFAMGSALGLIVLTSVGVSQVADGVDRGWAASLQVLDALVGGVASSALGWIHPASWFEAGMSEGVRVFIKEYCHSASPPLVDSLFLLAVLGIANLSVLVRTVFGKLSLSRPTSGYFLPQEYFSLIGSLMFGVLLWFGQASTEAGIGDIDISIDL